MLMLCPAQACQSTALFGIVFALAFLHPRDAAAVRPFVSDDARIIDVGQFENETWVEFQRRGDGQWTPGMHAMVGVTVNDWLEIIAGGGIGLEGVFNGDQRTAITVTNPILQPKILLWRADEDGFPGVAIAAGVTFAVGRGGWYDDATGYFLMVPVTTRLFQDKLHLHFNLGGAGATEPDGNTVIKPYWGVAFEAELLGERLPNLVGEIYAGDPFEALGPTWAAQYGLRWIASDYFNMDLTFGTQPDLHHGGLEHWGQIGLRFLWDVFTQDGKPGSFMGARGAFSLRPRSP